MTFAIKSIFVIAAGAVLYFVAKHLFESPAGTTPPSKGGQSTDESTSGTTQQ